jgi:NADH:ubiquinone oxidoreductase subunit D
MDYLSPLSNNLGFSLAAERLLGIEVPPRGQYLRVIMCELAGSRAT